MRIKVKEIIEGSKFEIIEKEIGLISMQPKI